MYMKKFLFSKNIKLFNSLCKLFFCGIFALFFFGCKNASSSEIVSEQNTLKSLTNSKLQNIQWTNEIEKNRLKEKIHSSLVVSKSLSLTPDVMIALEGGIPRNPIYPSIDDFGSLDISDLDYKIYDLINSFFIDLKNSKNCDFYIAKNSIFAISLFMYDLGQLSFSLNNLSWIMGKPFLDEEIIEVPIRLNNETNSIDIHLYLKDEATSESSQSDFKIVDFEIYRFDKKLSEAEPNGK